ncbi:MAG: hypothetical protein Q8N23_05375 [Archangium sp.]|nr:hypothetical protein [Archangium sp.]MDP3574572.1 hypothetical protein [Archangium sp.]
MSVAHLFAEARALTRDGVVPARLISELQHRLEQTKDVLQGSTIAAMALLASARGERTHARELMESMAWLDQRALTEGTREYAQGWLVTDAAAEGDWARVRSLLPATLETPTLRLFAHLAGRALDGAAPNLASDDWYQLPLDARRFSEAFSVKAVEPVRPRPELAEPIASMLWQLLELTPARLSETAKAVGALLKSPKLRDRLMERATLIGGGSPDEALGDLREVFDISLGAALKAHVDEPLLSGVASARREQLLDTMYTRIDRLTDRCSEGTAPPMTEVWREFVAIRGCYSQAVALSEPGERGWPHHVVLRLMRYLGTWLRLTKKQLPFAHAVFRFLDTEGTLAGDETGARLARASAELCLPFGLTANFR